MTRTSNCTGYCFDNPAPKGYSLHMRANMHLHSRYSDGTIWPAQVAERAAAAGLGFSALTDHDTLGGTEEFMQAAKNLGITTVPGVEMDCREPSIQFKSEILAYFPSGHYENTRAFLREINSGRLKQAKEAILRSKKYFNSKSLDFHELLIRKRADRTELPAECFSFNKVDMYLYLRDAGAIRKDVDYKTFKRTYFDSRILVDGSRDKPLCSEIAKIVLKDGGFLVIPHIGHEFDDQVESLKKEKNRLGLLVDYFQSIGVAGLELYHYRNSSREELNRLIRKEAKVRGLFCTYGSDCHGPASGKDTIADFYGDMDAFPWE